MLTLGTLEVAVGKGDRECLRLPMDSFPEVHPLLGVEISDHKSDTKFPALNSDGSIQWEQQISMHVGKGPQSEG